MTEENKKDDIEIVEKPEYADMILNDVRCHGTDSRKPKEWYPELLYNSEKHQSARIITQMQNTRHVPCFGANNKDAIPFEQRAV